MLLTRRKPLPSKATDLLIRISQGASAVFLLTILGATALAGGRGSANCRALEIMLAGVFVKSQVSKLVPPMLSTVSIFSSIFLSTLGD